MKPVVYLVPLMAREVSKDWEATAKLCQRTIVGLLAAEAEVRVILVCNQAPELPSDPRLVVIEHDFPLPQKWEDGHHDKYRKIQWGLAATREFAPCWLMKVDADDLVSRRLPEFMAHLPDDAPGAIVRKGFLQRPGGKWLLARDEFDLFCGTSNVLSVGLDDLPENGDCDASHLLSIRLGHHICRQYFEDLGTPLHSVPFPAVIYSVEHGGNHSGCTLLPRSRRHALARLLQLRYASKALMREFGQL